MGCSMSTASTESVPDDVLRHILLRLSPHPTCLPRVSLVCKTLHRFVTDAAFLASFRDRHRDALPPLLGFFHDDATLPSRFVPVGGDGSRVSTAAFDPKDHPGGRVLDSRHGRVLLQSPNRRRLLVWDPIAGRRRYVAAPRLEKKRHYEFSTGAVLCAAGHGDGHGRCRGCPFTVVFVITLDMEETVHAFVYSSEAAGDGEGEWEEVATIDGCSSTLIDERQALLLGNILYWTPAVESILAFEVNTHYLYEIDLPPEVSFDVYEDNMQVVDVGGSGVLGVAAVADNLMFHLWAFQAEEDSIVRRWVLLREVHLDQLLPMVVAPVVEDENLPAERILGVDGGQVFLRTVGGILQVDLQTSKSTRLCDGYNIHTVYPYRSF